MISTKDGFKFVNEKNADDLTETSAKSGEIIELTFLKLVYQIPNRKNFWKKNLKTNGLTFKKQFFEA